MPQYLRSISMLVLTFLILQSSPAQNVNKIHAFDDLRVIVVGDSGLVAQTSDRGDSWRKIYVSPYKALRAVSFADSLVGCIVGEGGTILRTTDCGLSWNQQNSGVAATLVSVSFSSTTTGCALAEDVILSTTDAGCTWKNLGSVSASTMEYSDMFFVSSGLGFLTANGWAWWPLAITTDGGLSWTLAPQTSAPGVRFEAVDFLDSTSGMLAGSGPYGTGYSSALVVRTTDGGATWTSAMQSYSYAVASDIKMISRDTAWVVHHHFAYGFDTNLLRTTNGGLNWSFVLQSLPYCATASISFVSSKAGWFAGANGDIRRTTDGGATWDPVSLVTEVASDRVDLPQATDLFMNYPNPFNPTTTIAFTIPVQMHVSLKIYDLFGKRLATLVSGEMEAGLHSFHWNATGYSSGVYFYQLITEGHTKSGHMLLVK